MKESNNPCVVLYSCKKCDLKDVPVEVTARKESDDVVKWVSETMGRAIGKDHFQKSPECHIHELQDVKIPVDNVRWIGDYPDLARENNMSIEDDIS